MSDSKSHPRPEVEHGGQRPLQSNNQSQSGSGVQADVIKGQRPAQEGHRPEAATPNDALGPMAAEPGSGVPPKK
jgi:hypothetical protein